MPNRPPGWDSGDLIGRLCGISSADRNPTKASRNERCSHPPIPDHGFRPLTEDGHDGETQPAHPLGAVASLSLASSASPSLRTQE